LLVASTQYRSYLTMLDAAMGSVTCLYAALLVTGQSDRRDPCPKKGDNRKKMRYLCKAAVYPPSPNVPFPW